MIATELITQTSRVFADSGNGSKRRRIWLDSIQVNENQHKALISFHAFAGNDYLSAFFRKGKQLCWEKIFEKENFQSNFIELGSAWDISDNLQAGIEKFVTTTHQTIQVLMIQNFRSLRKSNCRQSRSLIFLSYPHVRVR